MRSYFMLCLLVLIWCGFSNDFSLANIGLAVIVTMVCLMIIDRAMGKPALSIRILPLLSLLLMTVIELFKSSLLVTWEVLTPKQQSSPKIMKIDLACQTDEEKSLLANLLSLTPGTLSVDISKDKSQLVVHVMFAHQPEQVTDFVKNRLEPKVIGVFYDRTH